MAAPAFGLLGPLELNGPRGPIELTAARQRELLSLLLLRPNVSTPADRLAEELWDGRPPPSARKALQVHVVALRRVLGGDRIETRAGGYRLRVDDGELDLTRFERLLAGAREHLDEQRPAESLEAADSALALWRGDPLPDVADLTACRGAVARLRELHALALETRADATLALGRAGDVIGDLEAAVAAEPLRERPAEQLMLALYRCGRQADALGVARSLRARLRDQLGLDPGPATQRLEQAILRQDPALEAGLPAHAVERTLALVLTASTRSPLRALAAALEGELVIARIVETAGDVAAATLEAEGLGGGRAGARAAAFASGSPLLDAARLAREQGASLLLLGVVRAGLTDAAAAAIPWPCTLALAADGPESLGAGPLLVPFGGGEHEWAALELATALARAGGRELRLLGAERAGRDASRLLANASLLIQRVAGVRATPVLRTGGADAVVEEAGSAALVLLGLGRGDGAAALGDHRLAVVDGSPAPVVCVRAGLRPGLLAPRHSWTNFSWSLGRS